MGRQIGEVMSFDDEFFIWCERLGIDALPLSNRELKRLEKRYNRISYEELRDLSIYASIRRFTEFYRHD